MRISLGSCGGLPDFPGSAFGFGMNFAIRCHCSFVSFINHISARIAPKIEVLGWLLIELLSYWLMGIPWAPYIRNWLLNLWPVIEFDFGPEHMKVEKLRRLRISIVFSTAIIPIVIAIGYDLLKYFLTK